MDAVARGFADSVSGVAGHALLLGMAVILATGLWRGRAVSRALASAPEPEIEAAGLADLLAAAVTAGVSVPGALVAVGQAAGGHGGRTLVRAGVGLVHGVAWHAAWAGRPERLDPLERALADA